MKSYFYTGKSSYYGSTLINTIIFTVGFQLRYTNTEYYIIYNLDTLRHYMNDAEDSIIEKYKGFTTITSEISIYCRDVGRYHSNDECVLDLNEDQFKLSIGNIFMID